MESYTEKDIKRIIAESYDLTKEAHLSMNSEENIKSLLQAR